MKIGAHISSSGGYLAMARTAVSIGANVFQFFTRNPRGGDAKALDLDDVAAFNVFAAREGIGPILAHAPYTLNAAAARPEIREFAENTMRDDLERLEHTPGAMYNFHPGSHVGQGAEDGIELISAMLGRIWRKPYGTTVLLETMAGKGSEIGRDFAEIRAVIDRTLALAPDAKLGVCLDTCHVWDGGYDIVNRLDETLEEFDRTVGLGRLKAIHLNDSMNPLGAHKDRHQKIGQGHIGLEAFRRIVNHPALKDLPFYLETPNDIAGYADEIKLLKGLVPC